jgi:hypothetical protein
MESGSEAQRLFRDSHKSLKNQSFKISLWVGVSEPQIANLFHSAGIGQIGREMAWSAHDSSRHYGSHEAFVTGHLAPRTHFSGKRVNQALALIHTEDIRTLATKASMT